MAEYVKGEYAIDAVLDVYYETPDIDLSGEKFEAAIFKIPPADVVPVRHGRWELTGADKRGRGGNWKCTGSDGCGKSYPYRCDYCRMD